MRNTRRNLSTGEEMNRYQLPTLWIAVHHDRAGLIVFCAENYLQVRDSALDGFLHQREAYRLGSHSHSAGALGIVA